MFRSSSCHAIDFVHLNIRGKEIALFCTLVHAGSLKHSGVIYKCSKITTMWKRKGSCFVAALVITAAALKLPVFYDYAWRPAPHSSGLCKKAQTPHSSDNNLLRTVFYGHMGVHCFLPINNLPLCIYGSA